jgi:hypothetical protein
VRRRGAFGRKASCTLRSLYALLLGLGGWFVGVLIVLAALPTVPLTDELLTTISVGVSIGLGTYLAWVNRGWNANIKATGFAAAAGSALVGAWLGYNVTSAAFGLFAPLLAIFGAVLGANLILLALDIAWARQERDRFAANPKETLEARPSTG